MTGETAAAGAAGPAETEEPIGPATETGKPAGPAAETGKPAAAATGTEAAQRPAARQRKSLRRTRRYLARFSLAGLTGALACYCLSPRLAFHIPGWLRGPRGPGVSPSLHWYPLVTSWQVTADMADSTSVPAGAGHVYSTLDGASAWASIISPPGWTPERTAALARQPAG